MRMKRTFRRSWTVALAVLVVSALALPAYAGVESGSVVVQGTATVGDSIGGGTIPQDGTCVPTGKGLHAPGAHGSGKNKSKAPAPVVVNKEVYYRLAIPDVTAVIEDTNTPTASGAYTGVLNVCGIVSPGPGGIGAACGSSMGRDGKGRMTLTPFLGGAVRDYYLQDVAWVTAAGGVLPVYGHITRIGTPANPTDKTMKQSSKGTFNGEINASGAQACIAPKPGGARTFTVAGTVVAEALGKPAPKQREQKLTK